MIFVDCAAPRPPRAVARACLGAILNKSYDEALDPALIPIPSAETIESKMVKCGSGEENAFVKSTMDGMSTPLSHSNWLAAEACLQLARYDEALAHAERFESVCWGPHVPCWAPWLKARIIGRKAQRESAGSENQEAFALLQRSHAAAKQWGRK